jgi:DNA-binding response OmpR family regulator
MRTVAVVDDEPLICDLIKGALSSAGVEVHCASSGKLGAELLSGRRFHLALIDAVLPDASGIALAEIAVNENTPVLLMSGHPNSTDRLTQLGLPYLEKPFRLSTFSIEAAQVIADSARNIERVKDSISRLRATIEELNSAMGQSRRLLEVSRRLVERATACMPY